MTLTQRAKPKVTPDDMTVEVATPMRCGATELWAARWPLAMPMPTPMAPAACDRDDAGAVQHAR